MKTEIQSSLLPSTLKGEFNDALIKCIEAKNVKELSINFRFTNYKSLIFDFAGSHFWLKQNADLDHNLLFISFQN